VTVEDTASEGAAVQLANQVAFGDILSAALNVVLELGVADRLADDQPDFGKLIDIEMMLMPGGRERAADEFASLFSRAGCGLARILPTESPLSVIEARVTGGRS
jgi:hypothetical protein